MAASVAPVTEAYSSSSLSTADNIRLKDSSSSSSGSSNKSNSNSNTQETTTSNSHELCRSCGKTSEDLYDLYHHSAATKTTTPPITTTTNSPQLSATDEATMPSPFTTSSTTCYGKSSTTATLTANSNNTTSFCLSTATSCSSASTAAAAATSTTATTFDSVAATAKATAKGQSNMENILQEMQIWHLQIKCHDGLPQRICAKCTAQFYMIHKFRRKCLKVQAQLRGLYEDQQQQLKLQQPLNEVEPEPKKQLAKTVADTEQSPTTPTSKEEPLQVPATSGQADGLTNDLPSLHNDCINDKSDQQQEKTSVLTTTAVSLSSVTDSEKNANDVTTPPTSGDIAQETMEVEREEATTIGETQPKSLPLFDIDNDRSQTTEATTSNVVVAAAASSLKDNKQTKCPGSSKQKCGNDMMIETTETRRKRRNSKDRRRSKSTDKCVDNVNDDDDVVPPATTTQSAADNNQTATQLAEDAQRETSECSRNPTEKRRKGRPRKSELLKRSKSSPECCSLLTKAALKSYSTVTTRATSSAYDKKAADSFSVSDSSLTRQQQLLRPLKTETGGEQQQVMACEGDGAAAAADPQQTQQPATDIKPSGQTIATGFVKQEHQRQVSMTGCTGGLASATGKMRNDNNNNNDQRRQNEADNNAKESSPSLDNFPENSKHSSASSSKTKSKRLHKADVKEALNAKRRAAEPTKTQLQGSVASPEELAQSAQCSEQPPRQRRKCSTSQYNKRDHHRQHRHKLSEKSTMKRALCSSAASPPELKTDTSKRRGRRRRQEAKDVGTSCTLGQQQQQQHEEIIRHKSKRQQERQQQQHTKLADENETSLTSHKAAGETENTTNKVSATAITSIFAAKACLNSIKANPNALSPMLLSSSAASSSSFYPPVHETVPTVTPAGRNPVNALNDDYKTMLAYNANDVKWQRRRSQRLSTSSSASSLSSSSSSSLSTDDDDDDDNDDDDVYYEANAYHRLQDIRNSLTGNYQQHGNTPLQPMYSWKTKAQMKANANDMQIQNIFKATSLDHIKPIKRENPATVTSESTMDEANSSTCSITEGLRTQTLDDGETNASNSQHCSSDNDEHHADDHHHDDGNDDHDAAPVKVTQNSERPEEAVQKQIKLKQQSNDRFADDDDSEAQCSEAEISCNSKEFNNKTNGDNNAGKQKPAISIPTANTDDATTTLTPSSDNPTKRSLSGCSDTAGGGDNHSRGGMKLILQRRSSTRFTCLRKDEILEEQAQNTSPSSSASSSPARKRKRKQRKEDNENTKMASAVNLQPDTKTTSDRVKEIAGQTDETHDLLNRETKRHKKDQPIKGEEVATTKMENIQTKHKTNNGNQTHMGGDAAISPGPHITEDVEETTVTQNPLHKSTSDDAALELEKDNESIGPETEDNQKLVIRVPLASLTQNFKRMHLTKDNEDDGKGKENQVDCGGEKADTNEAPAALGEELNKTKPNPVNETENLMSAETTEQMDLNEISAPVTADDTKNVQKSEEAHDEKVPEPTDNVAAKDKKIEQEIFCETDAMEQINPLESAHDQTQSDPAADAKSDKDQTSAASTIDDNLTMTSNDDNKIENETVVEPHNITCESQGPPLQDALEISSLAPEILEFVQETESRGAEEISGSQGFCGASSKITDFINDFQNNCINSPEAEGDGNTMDVLPPLPTASNPNLSDEIRDVEDTLNGILSEMHDRDMYTPRSGETEDFLAHSSIYSPMTDAPTTPSQSLYAESPRTVNSNPMSLSPFIPSQMDYNAMTPQSNHSSSVSGHTTATTSSNSSSHLNGSGGGGGASSDHFHSYTDCFAEESTQSELIGFQNDIPCFENIDLPPTGDAADELLAIPNDAEETLTPSKQYSNKDLLESLDKAPDIKKDLVVIATENLEAAVVEPVPSPLPHLAEIATVAEKSPATVTVELPEANVQYTTEEINPTIIQVDSTPASQQISCNTITTPDTVATHQQYVLTNTPHGPVFISTPPDNAQQPPQQNVQYVTLESNNAASKLGWSNPPAPAAAATYFLNASGEVYLSNPSFNTLLVPPQPTTPQPSPMDTNENYLQVYQGQPQQHQQQNNNNGPQYIMLVNNLSTGGQQYITNPNAMGTSTVLLHTQVPNNNCSYINSQPATEELDLNATAGNGGTTMPTFSIATTIPGQHATVSLAPDNEEPPTPPPVQQQETRRQTVQKLLQQKIQQQKAAEVAIKPRVPNNRTQKINLVCRFCHKRPKFTNNVDYSNHIITMHPAEKPYNCDYCPKHFQRRSERQDHVAQVHGSRYQCAQCGVSFCAQRALDFHLQKYHASSLTCSIPPRIATVAPTQQLLSSASSASASASSMPAVNHLQQNSTSSASLSASSPTTYHLLHNANNAQQQRLVRVEDVHTHNAEDVEAETKNNKCSFDSQLDIMDGTTATHQQQQHQQQQQHYQKPTRKLCCPDCDGDDESCCSVKNNPQNNHKQLFNQQQYAGVYQPPPHITIPSPEQTEPDSTTTLRHFRKNPMKSPTIVSTTSASNSNCITYSSCTYSNNSNSGSSNNNDNNSNNNNNNHYGSSSPGGVEYYGAKKYMSRDMHNCHLCDDAFPTANALRRHRNIAHNQHSTVMPFICTICKRGFRLRNALQRHMETHDAEGRPYECNICQVRFPRPSQLTLHKLTVHKFERVHTCDECGKQFGTESSLKAHEKVAHEANSMPLPFACVYLEAPKHQKPRVSKE